MLNAYTHQCCYSVQNHCRYIPIASLFQLFRILAGLFSLFFFCRWALQPPGWKQSWHCGVRVASNRKLVGFISAVPAHIRIKAQ